MKSLISLAALLVFQAGPAFAQNADLILFGGPIHTADPARPVAEAVAVEDGRIVYVGSRSGAFALSDGDTRRIDLRGAALFPGFTDGHAHLIGIGQRELTLDLSGAPSIAAAMQELAAWAAANPDGPIIGRGWIETHWPESRFLNRQDLDAAAPGRVVILTRADGHALVASSAALTLAGFAAETTAPAGGEIERDGQGEPTGLLIDAAMALISPAVPSETADARRRALQTGMQVYVGRGWTGMHNMSAAWGDVQQLEDLDAEGAVALRLYNAVDIDQAEPLFVSGPRGTDDGLVITRAIKVYADGALGSRGAALFEPYADAAGSTGLMQTTPDAILPSYRRALERGLQIATHAIGDRGNAAVLDWYEEVGAPATARWRIEHAQIVRPSDLTRFGEDGIIASMQPSHAIGDLHFAPARLGEARLDGAYAWRALVEDGAVVVGGSDAPVEVGSPLIEFYAAVARRDLQGYQGPDWHSDQALTREQALALFTTAPAYASFREDELGMIRQGFRADLTVFDIDLMTAPETAIPQGRALLTVVDGRIVFEAEVW
ncbi:MAG: amidohydrolase [Caulobacterales bacterium]|nr:amidohydrolase [Caulobacterales bacterium]